MSNLNPGGSRSLRFARVFGAANIARVVTQNLKGRDIHARGSIADKPHSHSREVARRLRQKGLPPQ